MVEDNLVLLVQRIIQNSLYYYFEITVGEDFSSELYGTLKRYSMVFLRLFYASKALKLTVEFDLLLNYWFRLGSLSFEGFLIAGEIPLAVL